jgi:hypothetical protein
MGIAIAILAVIGLLVAVVWVLLHPAPETTMGMENRARREAKRAAKRKDAEA